MYMYFSLRFARQIKLAKLQGVNPCLGERGKGTRKTDLLFLLAEGVPDSIGWTAPAEGSKLGQDRMKSRERYRQAKQIDTALGRTGEDWKEKDKAWMGTCACNVHVCNHQIAPPRGTNIGWASY